MIHPLSAIDLRLVPGPWPLDAATEARVAAHWADALAANPRLWDGRVLGTVAPGWPGGVAIADGVLTGTAREGAFSQFLAWRDWGFPEIGIRNLFGSAVVLSADGALIYGVMGPQTANAGRIYPPGGSLEPADAAADGRIDVLASIARELFEETGLDRGEAVAEELLAVFDGPRISIAEVLRFAEPAAVLAARIGAAIAAERDPELAGVAVLRRASEAADDRFPPYAQALAAHLLPR